MKTRVTFTGLDAGLQHSFNDRQTLFRLQKKYPFVEFGVLLSESRQGKERRYPDYTFFYWLEEIKDKYNIALHLSLHLCGSLAVRVLDKGFGELPSAVYRRLHLFRRIQFNIATVDDLPDRMSLMIDGRAGTTIEEFILQLLPGDGAKHIWSRVKSNRPVSVLYDASGGTGRVSPFHVHPYGDLFKAGFAGGINADNVVDRFREALSCCTDDDFWIDMESGVRDSLDQFDVRRVVSVIDALAKDAQTAAHLGIVRKRTDGVPPEEEVLRWHPADEPIELPEDRTEVEVLLKVENLPFGYVTAVWNGEYFRVFSTYGYPERPLSSMPESIGIVQWAYLNR